jgi:hypothetical protein
MTEWKEAEVMRIIDVRLEKPLTEASEEVTIRRVVSFWLSPIGDKSVSPVGDKKRGVALIVHRLSRKPFLHQEKWVLIDRRERFTHLAWALSDFFAIDVQVLRGFYPDSDVATTCVHNGDSDAVANENRLATLSRENEHGATPFVWDTPGESPPGKLSTGRVYSRWHIVDKNCSMTITISPYDVQFYDSSKTVIFVHLSIMSSSRRDDWDLGAGMVWEPSGDRCFRGDDAVVVGVKVIPRPKFDAGKTNGNVGLSFSSLDAFDGDGGKGFDADRQARQNSTVPDASENQNSREMSVDS